MNDLLMLHGWGFPAAVFAGLEEGLSSDFIVRMPEQTGYGDAASQYAIESPQNTGFARLSEPTLVVGWSLGGIRAVQLALSQPDMVKGLVLLATTPCFVNRQDWQAGMDERVFHAFQQQVIADPAAAMQQFVRLNSAARPDRQSRGRLNDLSSKVDPSALQEGLIELESTDLRHFIDQVTIPVLIIHAADDRVVPVAASCWLHEHLLRSQFIEFPSGGHAFFIQHAASVVDRIREFINEVCNDRKT